MSFNFTFQHWVLVLPSLRGSDTQHLVPTPAFALVLAPLWWHVWLHAYPLAAASLLHAQLALRHFTPVCSLTIPPGLQCLEFCSSGLLSPASKLDAYSTLGQGWCSTHRQWCSPTLMHVNIHMFDLYCNTIYIWYQWTTLFVATPSGPVWPHLIAMPHLAVFSLYHPPSWMSPIW